MGSGSKWTESQPDDSPRKVARRAIKSHLERMWRYLTESVEGPRSETENVHQLRVFSRRADAAMEIFQDSLPKRRGHWMRKQVKRLRKASGEARDFDVLMIRWAERLEKLPSGEVAVLLDEIKRRRRDAQQPIDAIYKKLAKKKFGRRISELARRIDDRVGDPRCQEQLACVARAALVGLVVPYLDAGEAALEEAEALHAFRIQGKQVRYVMEIFGGAFDDDFRQQLYPMVADLQDRLGNINDHVTAKTYFAEWHTATQSCVVRRALEFAIAHEQQAFEAAKREFLDWWTAPRRQDLRSRFARYVQLAGPDQHVGSME
jgi:CHAD domain-containing protein